MKQHATDMKKTLLRVLSYFQGRYLLLLLVIITASLTGVGSIFGTYYAGIVTDHILAYFVIGSNITNQQALNTLQNDITVLISVYSASIVCSYLHNQIMVFLTQRVLFNLRKQLMSKMHSLPLSYLESQTHGQIMSHFTNDIDSMVNALNDSIANIFLSLTNMVGTIVSLFVINVPLSLIVIIFIIAMFVSLYFNGKASRKYFVRQQKALADVNGIVEEDIAGIKVIKAFNHEDISYKKFEKANRDWENASRNAFYHTQVNTPVFVSLSYLNFSISAICGIIALCTGWAGVLTFGGLQSYLMFTRNACQPFNYFTTHVNNILAMSAGAERIFTFLDEKEEEDNGYIVLKKIKDENGSHLIWYNNKTKEETLLKGHIVFEHVHFSYVKGKEILNDISFECHPGKKIAFVGSTGAGKTTIISLLARFYPLDSGSITYDGININDIRLESLRRALSMVTQDTHLFTGTIEDNIRYVRRHSTKEEVVKAAISSRADFFIEHMPNSYQTMLYDDGANLSEGQRQLLGITRATLNQPPVMILDEATSNIDTRSEQLIQKSLSELMENRSVMVIAHRLSTVRDADEILVLEKGKIIERGKQEELLALKGSYYDLYTGKKELS